MEELHAVSFQLSDATRILFARSFQEGAWFQLGDKLEMTLTEVSSPNQSDTRQHVEGEKTPRELRDSCKGVKHLVVSGGVASNLDLRKS